MTGRAVPNEIIIPSIKMFIDEGHTATFLVRGWSMRPFLEHERDNVLLAPVRDDEPVRRGDVVLAEIATKVYVLHRVVRVDGDRLTLRGDGNAYGEEHCLRSNVIGRAVGFFRKGREEADKVTDAKWRIYSALWPSNSFLRRCLLFLFRKTLFRRSGRN